MTIKRNVTLKQCEVPDGYEAVEFRIPTLMDEFINGTGMVVRCNAPPSSPRIIVRRIEPKRVPLEAWDIVPGQTILNLVHQTHGGSVVVFANSTECIYINGVGLSRQAYQSLFEDEERTYSNDHGATWQPCSKPGT
ncbi:MAG: hypothetical protein EBR82_18355 [Caulobacteraceae bacterium]|nr:hypothetical protein [Caulobacteraceae bacterium]